MTILSWQESIEIIRPYIVKISTPRGFGTGFLFSYSQDRELCGVATAAHVVNHAHWWQQPIRIQHYESGQTGILKEDDRAVFLDNEADTAAIVFVKEDFPFPNDLLNLAPEGRYLRVGYEVGWVGFPAISPQNFCFFIGRVSTWIEDQDAYLVDGVAINGVSGGPTFIAEEDNIITIMGVVTAYLPNRATGESLPGLCLISDVSHFHDVVKAFESIDHAKEEEVSVPPLDQSSNDLEVPST